MHAHTGTEQRKIFMNAFHALCICAQLCLPLCNHRGNSPPDSSVHGIFQAKVLGGLPFPAPWDLPDPGIELMSLVSPALAGGFFTTEPSGKPIYECSDMQSKHD